MNEIFELAQDTKSELVEGRVVHVPRAGTGYVNGRTFSRYSKASSKVSAFRDIISQGNLVFNASKGFSGQIKPVLGADIRSSSLNKSGEQQKLQSRHIYREDQQVKTQDLMLAQSETGPLHKKEEQAHLLEAQSSVQHEDAFKAERSIQKKKKEPSRDKFETFLSEAMCEEIQKTI